MNVTAIGNCTILIDFAQVEPICTCIYAVLCLYADQTRACGESKAGRTIGRSRSSFCRNLQIVEEAAIEAKKREEDADKVAKISEVLQLEQQKVSDLLKVALELVDRVEDSETLHVCSTQQCRHMVPAGLTTSIDNRLLLTPHALFCTTVISCYFCGSF